MDGVRMIDGDAVASDAAAGLTFEAFFRAEHARLFRSLCLMTASRHEADEIAQIAFVRVLERWDRVSAMDDPTGYLFRVAVNVVRSRYRAAKRVARAAVALDRPDDAFAAIEDRDAVIDALRGLPRQQRTAVVLTVILGYTSEEAGRMLGMSAGTVRTHAARARVAMRSRVGEPS
jgi:RNA polymerase sigma-70 factor, ECF subfamily